MNARLKVTTVFAAALLAAACTDTTTPPSLLEPSTAAPTSATQNQAAERAALNELTRAVALALQDQGLRQRIKNDMRRSVVREHKLEFSNYLRGNSGGILLVKMASATGRSPDEILALLGNVRPLEFYMPVYEHRTSWRGGPDLLVASLLEDHTVPVGYNLKGEQVMLSADQPPATPTLGLVPVETYFGSSTTVAATLSIATLAEEMPGSESECETCVIEPIDNDGSGGGGGSVGGGSTSKPAGLYMTFSHIVDDGEAWIKEYPEIEAHVHGLYDPKDPQTAISLACAGERQVGRRYFNQDSKTWSGEVLLFTQQEIEDANLITDEGYNIMLWEDDDTACTIKLDNTSLTNTLKAIRDALGVVSVFLTPVDPEIKARALVAFFYRNASWLLSNDDWLGVAIDQKATGDQFTDATHRLEKRPDLTTGKPNGRIKLVRYGF